MVGKRRFNPFAQSDVAGQGGEVEPISQMTLAKAGASVGSRSTNAARGDARSFPCIPDHRAHFWPPAIRPG